MSGKVEHLVTAEDDGPWVAPSTMVAVWARGECLCYLEPDDVLDFTQVGDIATLRFRIGSGDEPGDVMDDFRARLNWEYD